MPGPTRPPPAQPTVPARSPLPTRSPLGARSPLAVVAALFGAVAAALLAACAPAPVAPLPGQWPTRMPAGAASPSAVPSGSPGRTSAAPPAAADRPPVWRPPTPTPGSAEPTPVLSPACLPPVIYPVDGSDPALLPRALCFEVAGILRVQNVGPGLLTAEPDERVARNYAAGVHDVRFLTAGTATVTIIRQDGSQQITVLVVEPTAD
ncbi:hypothetical protein O7627_09655 [Solwaraspora sp. WMMD1047]|uniref:hypothetical protein n=1 Tax=Solwaraspora sp. WMMD1047 TaxID=3016102 RepID=UPI002417CFB0|nr:hypothetical protein [Solwaraspora sp. WMMD1047]MDG4829566.1 hypothetical protein [Solwaraspora sp. WMMD1047]